MGLGKSKWVVLALFWCSLLGGCTTKPVKQSTVRVVTQIAVTASHNNEITQKVFQKPEKMEAILNYLRLLDPYLPSKYEAETFRSDAFEIIVHYSDGNHTTYHQIYHDYLKTDSGAWLRINSVYGSKLLSILENMPTDA